MEVSFVVLATAGLAITGWLGAGSQLLGGRSFAETLSGPGTAVLGAWMVSVALVSLALPVLALAIWGRREGVSRALLPYMLVLVAQILVEMVFAKIFFQNIVILTGTTFTLYRLGQLVYARRAFSVTEGAGRYGRAVVGGILSLGLVFWSANLAFLLLVALPYAIRFV